VSVLVWDFDGTLALRPGYWTGLLHEIVTECHPDLGITPEHIRPHLQRGFPWHTPDVLREPCSEDEWWAQMQPVFTGALRAGAGLPEAEARRLAVSVRARYLDPTSWRVFDDTRPALEKLAGLGWRHVILSNHVPELQRLVAALGLSEHLLGVYCSGVIGAEKPHPKAFEAVFADHPEARAGWMIGDSWRADVAGARAVGMRAILVRERHPEAALQCDGLQDVVAIVGAA
jgi:putative hydrolase of the HAD superfamily